jgi:integrase
MLVVAQAVEAVPRLAGVDLVFPSVTGGQLWATSFKWAWTPVRAAFGRPTMALHELRHFCATYLLELGLTPADVAVQFGHTDGGALIMSAYGHPSDRAARARITAAMEGHTTGDLRPFRGRGGT